MCETYFCHLLVYCHASVGHLPAVFLPVDPPHLAEPPPDLLLGPQPHLFVDLLNIWH